MPYGTTERNHRLEDVIETIREAGQIDREVLIGAIQRRWFVSGATARFYIEDLMRRGSITMRFGIVRLRFEDNGSDGRTTTEER